MGIALLAQAPAAQADGKITDNGNVSCTAASGPRQKNVCGNGSPPCHSTAVSANTGNDTVTLDGVTIDANTENDSLEVIGGNKTGSARAPSRSTTAASYIRETLNQPPAFLAIHTS